MSTAKDFVRKAGRRLYWNTRVNPAVLYDPTAGPTADELSPLPVADISLVGGARIHWIRGVPKSLYYGKVFKDGAAAQAFVEHYYWAVKSGKRTLGPPQAVRPMGEGAAKELVRRIGRVSPLDWRYTTTHRDPQGNEYAWLYHTPQAGGWSFHLFDEGEGKWRVTIGQGVSTLDHAYDEQGQHIWSAPSLTPAIKKARQVADRHVAGAVLDEGTAKDFLKKAHARNLEIKVPFEWSGATNYPFREVWYRGKYMGVIWRVDHPEQQLETCPPGSWKINKVSFWINYPYISASWPDMETAAKNLVYIFKGERPVVEGSAKAFIKSLPKNFASLASQGVWRKVGENAWVFALNNWMRVEVTASGPLWKARILFGHDELRSVKGTETKVLDFLTKEGYMPGGGLWKRERMAAGVTEGEAKTFLKRVGRGRSNWETISWHYAGFWFKDVNDLRHYLRVKQRSTTAFTTYEADFYQRSAPGAEGELTWVGGTGPFNAADTNDAVIFGKEQATEFFKH